MKKTKTFLVQVTLDGDIVREFVVKGQTRAEAEARAIKKATAGKVECEAEVIRQNCIFLDLHQN